MEIHHQLDTMVGVSIYQFLSPKMAIDIRTGGVPSETNHDKSKTKQTVCTVLQFELFKSVQIVLTIRRETLKSKNTVISVISEPIKYVKQIRYQSSKLE